MLHNIKIIDLLRGAGFLAGEITVNPEPGVRDVTIADASADPVTGEPRIDVARDAARVLADAGYDILCYGSGLGTGAIASLMVRLPAAGAQAA